MAAVVGPPPLQCFPCNRLPIFRQPSYPCATRCVVFRPPQQFDRGPLFWPPPSRRFLSFLPPSAEGSSEQANHVEQETDLSIPSSASEETHNKQSGKGRINETMEKLKRYGVAGVLSYGLLNTAYYLVTFLVVWATLITLLGRFYIAPAPARLGYAASVKRFLKIMAMVWAGSQITKLVRAGGAVALAPIVDNGLSWFTVEFKFDSTAKAFGAIVGFCFGLAVLLFLVLTLLWA